MHLSRPRAGLLVALAAACALPASAAANQLELYKVERHVVVADADYSVSCHPGDIATDGMWRVDHVDQDDGWIGNIQTAVGVSQAAPDAGDAATYDFSVESEAAGDAQMKLIVTCLGRTPSGAPGAVFSVGPRKADARGPDGPGLSTAFMPAAQECTRGETAIAPGFAFPGGFAGRLVASRASVPGDAGVAARRNWTMSFELDDTVGYTAYLRCLRLRSSGPSPHRIVVRQIGGAPTPATPIGAGQTEELRETCGQLYKGMVHGFAVRGADAPNTWFLGMDPRIKTRAYRFYDGDPLNQVQVWTGLTCLRDTST